MTCKFARYNNMREIFTCHQVRELKSYWLKEYRKVNQTDLILEAGLRDRAYEDYCKEIDQFLDNCKCPKEEMESWKCKNCSDDEHEGNFCRCENRNIRIAKQQRRLGLSAWDKALQKEKDDKR